MTRRASGFCVRGWSDVPEASTRPAARRRRFSPPAIASVVAALCMAVLPLRAETVVSLEFDDNNANQYQARQMLSDRGMRATFFIFSPRIGKSGYMTLAQLQDLKNDGNEIGGHGLDKVDLTTVTAAEAQRQVCDDRAACIKKADVDAPRGVLFLVTEDLGKDR